MKFCISHSHTKRSIDGLFHLYGSREDIEALVAQLVQHLKNTEWSAAWLPIYDKVPPSQETPAVPWDAN